MLRSLVSIFRIINMQSFCRLGAIVIGGIKADNKLPVLTNIMELGEVELSSDSEIDKNGFVPVKLLESFLHFVKCSLWRTALTSRVGDAPSGSRRSTIKPSRTRHISRCSCPVTRDNFEIPFVKSRVPWQGSIRRHRASISEAPKAETSHATRCFTKP